MFELESNFSVEWIFQACNVKNHCLHLSLKTPIFIGDKATTDVYVLKVIVDEKEQSEILKNIAAGKNTNYASIAVEVFTGDIPVTETVNIGLSLANIYEVEKVDD